MVTGYFVLDEWLAVPHPYMATVTTGLSDTDESSHLLSNLASAKLMV